jgi:hypothetical protein
MCRDLSVRNERFPPQEALACGMMSSGLLENEGTVSLDGHSEDLAAGDL